MTDKRCAWCARRFASLFPHQLYCDPRCSQAARDHRRRHHGTPGVRPARMPLKARRKAAA